MPRQGQRDAAAPFFGLQGFGVTGVEIRERFARGRLHRVKVVTLEDQRAAHECRFCRRRFREGAFQESEPLLLRDSSLGDFETYVEVFPWRVRCCGKTARERIPFKASGHRMTVRFFQRLAALCTRLPVWEVAQMAGLSWDTVRRVDAKAIEFALGGKEPSLEGLRYLGVDEVARRRGHVYFTIFTDLESGVVVHVADGRGRRPVEDFLDRLDKRQRRRIRVTASDLGYKALLEEAFPRAEHVLDRFHIVQWINDALTKLRRRIFGGGPRSSAGRTFKAKKWMLLSAREGLEDQHRRELDRLMKLNRPLYKAYLLKEEFRAILGYPWKCLRRLALRLRAWTRQASWSQLPEFLKLGRKLREYIPAVVSGFRHRVKIGRIEQVNATIKKLRTTAHGYSKPEYFKLKIYQRCSLETNPWRAIIL